MKVATFMTLAGFTNAVKIDSRFSDQAENDLSLIETIKSELLEPPTEKPYNLSAEIQLEGQYNQAAIVEKLFDGLRNGFFVEAGAFDGENFSNTLLFELKYNWTGLLVEPNPDNYEELKRKNRKTFSIESCFSTKDRVESIDFDAAGAYGGIINGQMKPGELPSKEKDYYRKRYNKKYKFNYDRRTLKMHCLPFNSIMRAMGNPVIHYLSLDIEGVELQVLQKIDFEANDIKVISLETTRIGAIFEGSLAQLKFFMKKKGYEFHASSGNDYIYIKRNFLGKEEL